MKTLTDAKNELKALIAQGIDIALKGIKTAIAEGTDKYNDLILLEGRYQDVSRQLLQGVIGDDAAQLEFNKIRKDLLDFIDSLKENHLATAEKQGADGKPDIYNGEVLYRIPREMQLQEEVKCLVRLAFDRKVIMEDLEMEKGDVLKDIRISEVMGVELIDPAGSAFEIRTLHDTVQFVEQDLFTEWIFFVKPIQEGLRNLVLKISIIEIRDGVERKRNVVLEEKVQIVSTVVEKSGVGEELQAAGIVLAMAQSQGGGGAPPAPKGINEGPRPAPKSGGAFSKITTIMSAVAVLLVATWAIFNLGGGGTDPGSIAGIEEQKAWDNVSQNPDHLAIRDFMNEYPESAMMNQARNALDSLDNVAFQSALASRDPDQMRNYLEQFPDGVHAAAASVALNEWKNDDVPLDTVSSPREQPPLPAIPEKGPKKPAKPKPKKPETVPPVTVDTTKQKPKDPEVQPPILDPKGDSKKFISRLPYYPGCRNDKDVDKEKVCTDKEVGAYIKKNLKYPREARMKDIQGTITVEFVIEKDGRVTGVQYNNDIGGGCAKEAVRLVQKLPKFEPGLDRSGKPVGIRYRLPISFKLR